MAWLSRNISINTPKSNAIVGVYGGKKCPLLSFALNHVIRTSDFPQFHLENKFSNAFIFNR